ncbi:hypothetical protein Q8A67_025799 [Cirrhinus molitorella]|uniref:Uncharacterized protein n=1 Tax=Cirrhinus molitorella TaxID=172907 RepID=A0AA88P0V2_9TELE|nr:hypothetical protein Q8A67_025799 [Cirrhinus molitorella]
MYDVYKLNQYFHFNTNLRPYSADRLERLRRRSCYHGITAHLYLHQHPSRRDQVSMKSNRSRSQPTDFTECCEAKLKQN